MQLNSYNIKWTWLTIFSLVIFLFLLNLSCKKVDQVAAESLTGNFFKTPPVLSSPVLRAIGELKRQNAITGFIEDFTKSEGFANWGKAIIEYNKFSNVSRTGGSADTLVFIPIIREGENYVSSFILARISDTVKLNLYREKDYDLHPAGSVDSSFVTAERVSLELMELNKNVYGITKFEVKDASLFNNMFPGSASDDIRTIELVEITYGSNKAYSAITCVQNRAAISANYHCYEWWFEIDEPYDWPPDAPIGGGSGGGSGGSTLPPDDCTGVPGCRIGTEIIDGKLPCGNCGPGPVVIILLGPNPPVGQFITFDQSINNTRLKCKLQSLMYTNTFFCNLVNTFDGVAGNQLIFHMHDLQLGAWAITRGFGNNNYAITTAPSIENTSNLFMTLTLTHEIIHARLYHSLEQANLLGYDQITYEPFLISANGNIPLQGLPEQEQLRLLIEVYNTLCNSSSYNPTNWAHMLFGTACFSENTYREAIQNLLLQSTKWDQQSDLFKAHFQTRFGTNWNFKLSQYLSWYGLNDTPTFDAFLLAENISSTDFNDEINYARMFGTKICPE